jgi:hypothetical protein
MKNYNKAPTGTNSAHALSYTRKINADSGTAERIFVDTRMNLYKSPEGFQTIMNWYNDIVAEIDVDARMR